MSIRVEKNGPIWTVIIDRPQARNAVDPKTAVELDEAWQEFDKDPNALVGVFHGDHGTFCAGADLKAVATGGVRYRDDPAGPGPMGPSRALLSKPVIASVAGYAVAGGLELALWCDMRVAEEDATFGVFCRRWGVPLIDGGTIRLPRLIGMSRALDMILTGRPVSAREALDWGLANRVVPKGHGRAEAGKLAGEIARFPQLCMRADRMSAYLQWDYELREALIAEGQGGKPIIEAEARAGAARFAAGKGRGGNFKEI